MRPHERIYHCLLFILPSSMRQEAGDELFETFNQEYARVVDAGRWSRARFWLRMPTSSRLPPQSAVTGCLAVEPRSAYRPHHGCRS